MKVLDLLLGSILSVDFSGIFMENVSGLYIDDHRCIYKIPVLVSCFCIIVYIVICTHDLLNTMASLD